jgi:hypothetical protein
MASVFDAMAAADAALFTDTFGESVSYRPLGVAGSAYTISAIVYRETRGGIFGGEITNDFNSMRVDIRSASNTVGRVSPQELETEGTINPDTILIDGTVWIVRRVLNKGSKDGIHQLEVIDGGQG